MKQVIQNFKTGELYVDEIPPPSISEGMVLVENKFSLISAGTERGTTRRPVTHPVAMKLSDNTKRIRNERVMTINPDLFWNPRIGI